MSRYNKNKIIKDDEGRRKLTSTLLVAPAKSEQDTYIQVYVPERLDLLAFRFYGDQTKWWIIAEANSIPKGTLYTPENTIIRIPANTNSFLTRIEEYDNGR